MAASSRYGLPVVLHMEAFVTLPLIGSTVITTLAVSSWQQLPSVTESNRSKMNKSDSTKSSSDPPFLLGLME